MNPFHRIVTIANNTLLESFRQSVFNVLLVFGLLVIGGGHFFSQFTFDEQFKFIKDLCLGVMMLTGVIIAIVSVAQMLPAEMESRTIYTILSKPVPRWEFLLGKYLGLALLLFLTLLVMSGLSFGMLQLKGHELMLQTQKEISASLGAGQGEGRAEVQQVLRKIRDEARDPRMIQAVLLIYAKILLVAAMGLFLSTFATSMMFTVVVTVFLYIIGHLQSIAREAWLDPAAHTGLAQKIFLALVSFLVPDMSSFNLVDDIVTGNSIPWEQTWQVLAYSSGYLGVVLLAACAVFSAREL